jgi:hypothetical protein
MTTGMGELLANILPLSSRGLALGQYLTLCYRFLMFSDFLATICRYLIYLAALGCIAWSSLLAGLLEPIVQKLCGYYAHFAQLQVFKTKLQDRLARPAKRQSQAVICAGRQGQLSPCRHFQRVREPGKVSFPIRLNSLPFESPIACLPLSKRVFRFLLE